MEMHCNRNTFFHCHVSCCQAEHFKSLVLSLHFLTLVCSPSDWFVHTCLSVLFQNNIATRSTCEVNSRIPLCSSLWLTCRATRSCPWC